MNLLVIAILSIILLPPTVFGSDADTPEVVLKPIEIINPHENSNDSTQWSTDSHDTDIVDLINKLENYEFTDSQSKFSYWMDRLYGWVPSAQVQDKGKYECSAPFLKQLMLQKQGDLQALNKDLYRFFDNCKRYLYGYSHGALNPLLASAAIRYPIFKNPDIKPIKFELPDKTILRGILGFRPQLGARPLIIVQCGIMCNISNTDTIRTLVAHLFDESPFNILILGSVSGIDYIKDNGKSVIGGFFEGGNIIQTARFFKANELSPYISSVHVLGFSLGGHSALYSSVHNSLSKKTGQNDIASVLTLCPVVSLQESISSLLKKGYYLKRLYFKKKTGSLISGITKHLPELGQIFSDKKKFNLASNGIINSMVYGSMHYYNSLTQQPNWMLEPMRDIEVKDQKSYWQANDFSKYSQYVSTPTLVIAAKNDPIVSSKHNTETLINNNSQIQVLSLPKGSHHVFSLTYGWDIVSTLIRNYFLIHSPQLLEKRQQIFEPISLPRFSKRLRFQYPIERLSTYYWKAYNQKKYVKLTFKIFMLHPQEYNLNTYYDCRPDKPYLSPTTCFRYIEFKIPYSKLEFLNMKKPASITQSQILTRWLNANVMIVGPDHKALWGKEIPDKVFLSYYSYQ